MATDRDDDLLPQPHDGMTSEEKGSLLILYIARGKPLAGLDFAEADLREQDLAGADLTGVRLARAVLWMTDLRGSSLRGATLADASFADVARDGFHSSAFADFMTADRSGWGEEDVERYARMGLDFDWDTFPEAMRIRFAGLPEPHRGMDVDEKSELLLTYARNRVPVEGLDFSGVRVRGSGLAGADLRGAILTSGEFHDADMSGCDLRDANLVHAHLSGADLQGADLRGSMLERARMNNASFRDARLEGAILEAALASSQTYTRSGWTIAALLELRQRGLQLVDLDRFPEDVRQAMLGEAEGLTLTFDTRLHRFDPTAFDALIAEVLGSDTDVTIEARSNIGADGPAFIRINGARPEDLVDVAEAFYERAWRADERLEDRSRALTRSALEALFGPRLESMRDQLSRVEANTTILAEEHVRTSILEKVTEHVTQKSGASVQTRFQRLASAVAEDAKKFLKASGTIDAVVAVVGEVVADTAKAIEDAGTRRFNRKLIEAGLDVPDEEGT